MKHFSKIGNLLPLNQSMGDIHKYEVNRRMKNEKTTESTTESISVAHFINLDVRTDKKNDF